MPCRPDTQVWISAEGHLDKTCVHTILSASPFPLEGNPHLRRRRELQGTLTGAMGLSSHLMHPAQPLSTCLRCVCPVAGFPNGLPEPLVFGVCVVNSEVTSWGRSYWFPSVEESAGFRQNVRLGEKNCMAWNIQTDGKKGERWAEKKCFFFFMVKIKRK